MPVRGVRGAIRVDINERSEIFAKTQELLRTMLRANRLSVDTVCAAFFTMTPDLNADFPAYAARDMGWTCVPMMCASEIAVPGSMDRVIRVLLLVNTRSSAEAIRHQYLGGTQCLRPDLEESTPRTLPRKRSNRNSPSTTPSVGGKR